MSDAAQAPAGGGGNKMYMLAGGILAVGIAAGVAWIMSGIGLTGFGQGIKSFMIDSRVGIAANPTLAIIIFVVAIGLGAGLIFMGAMKLLKGDAH